MSKLAVLDNAYDLFLGYSWGSQSQGISGHLYECIEYYYILKQHMRVGIFVCTSEELTIDAIRVAINDKYDFTEDEISELLSDVHFFDSPKVLHGNNILLVDGNFTKLRDIHLLFKNIMAFACFDRRFTNMENVTAFQDSRIYGQHTRHKHYIKKLLFSRYKKHRPCATNTNLVYIKNGTYEDAIFDQLEHQYTGDFLIVSGVPVRELSNRFTVVKPPITDLFEQFSTYIYTPIPKKFDCSPRFTAECKWYGKQVLYHNIDYWGVDHGLYYRFLDIQNDFDSLHLKEDDAIVDLIKGIINV